MSSLISGAIAGIMAAILMGIVSEAGYRTGIFRSSLFLVDGAFFLRVTGKGPGRGEYFAGIPIHIFTGAVFGSIYMAGTTLFSMNAFSPGLVSLYFFLLWLSMLFIALPLAGQGFMGRKASSRTWLEQLFLHIVFGVGYYYSLLALT